jgi:tetratricopeptide (TPR) repeat protein
MNPSYAAAHHDYAWFLVAMGRTEQGLTSLRRAIALDPLSVRVNIDAGWLLMQAHRYDQAIEQAKRALELDPGLEEANFCMKRARQYQHKDMDPIGQGGGSNPYTLAVHYASVGDRARAVQALEQAVEARSMMMPLLKVDPAFVSLVRDAGFQRLVGKVGIP